MTLLNRCLLTVLFGLRFPVLCLLKRILQELSFCFFLFKFRGQISESLFFLFNLLRSLDLFYQGVPFFCELALCFPGVLQSLPVLLKDGPDQDEDLLVFLFLCEDFFLPDRPELFTAGRVYALDVRAAAVAELLILCSGSGGLRLEPFLQLLIVFCVENIAQDFFAVLGVGEEEFEKVSLGDHADPGELVLVDPQQSGDIVCHIPLFGHGCPVRAFQQYVCRFRRRPLAVLLGPLIGRISRDRIVFAIAGKNKFHVGLCLRKGVLGAEHGFFPVLTARDAVEGETDGVKDGRFARAGVACDQVKAFCPQPVKIDDLFARIGAESGHFQSHWSHFLYFLFPGPVCLYCFACIVLPVLFLPVLFCLYCFACIVFACIIFACIISVCMLLSGCVFKRLLCSFVIGRWQPMRCRVNDRKRRVILSFTVLLMLMVNVNGDGRQSHVVFQISSISRAARSF